MNKIHHQVMKKASFPYTLRVCNLGSHEKGAQRDRITHLMDLTFLYNLRS
ncbi:hypothetical protein QUB80_09445 [Chlorogloeopsis sp. ULAP01]|nr:hypothetical protein [Chlorogloeopsis sp. ULAP01]MDM9380927.1 hypothetical protein [Chlorogloeopsis sp. ULAP01]